MERLTPIQIDEKQPLAILQIGCGGTGGWVAPHLPRIVEDRGTITLMDGDNVEESNLSRQNFIQNDMGKMKSDVLAQRYSRAYGKEITSIARFLNKGDLRKLARQEKKAQKMPVVLTCLDNHATRKIVHEDLLSYYNEDGGEAVWIDLGCEFWDGQIVVGTVGFNYNEEEKVHLDVPTFGDKFPELMENADGHPDDQNCAERGVHEPQLLGANSTAATLAVNAITCLVKSQPIHYNAIYYDIRGGFDKDNNAKDALIKRRREG